MPTEVTHLRGYKVRNILLCHPQFGAAKNLLQLNGANHRSRQIGIIEDIGVADELVGQYFQIFTAEAMAPVIGVVGKAHAEFAADAEIKLMHRAGEAEWRHPFHESDGIGESFEKAGRGTAENAVELNGLWHGTILLEFGMLFHLRHWTTHVGDWADFDGGTVF